MSGLNIHPEFQYLAGSPDGLIESDGILEVKCPFLIRNDDPEEAIKLGKVSYCNNSGNLKISSD